MRYCSVFSLLILSWATSNAQLINGSFESGLSGWSASQGVYVVGGAPSIGTDGAHAAQMGVFDLPNDTLRQTLAVIPGTNYQMTFDMAAQTEPGHPGLIAGLRADVVAGGQIIASLAVSNASGPIKTLGTNGFSRSTVSFTVPADTYFATILFSDVSPSGGYQVDVLVDNVRITGTPQVVTPVPPAISEQPMGQTIAAGGSVSFSVTASGSEPIGYIWRREGTPLPNAIGSSLHLENVQTGDAGTYTVVVSNGGGSATSAPARLVVVPVSDSGIVNGSFEYDLFGWTAGPSVFVIGPPTQGPIGVDGAHSANLGAFEAPGSFIAQTIGVAPGTQYLLSFASAANGAGTPGRTGVVQVIVQYGSDVLTSQRFTDVSPIELEGPVGFTPRNLRFTVPLHDDTLKLIFADASPNGGFQVDPNIDDVRLVALPSAEQAIAELALLSDTLVRGSKSKRSLLSTLEAALGLVDRGNMNAAASVLRAFQNKLQAQFRNQGDITTALSSKADEIIRLLDGQE